MMKRMIGLAVLGTLAMNLPMAASAAELYEQCLTEWGANASQVEGREFKFLIDPAKTDKKLKNAFKDIWNQSKAVLEKNGLKLSEREKKAWSLKLAVKTFYDTPNMDLFKKGYIIRTTTSFSKNRYPEIPLKVVVKRINAPSKAIFAAELKTADGKNKGVTEDNIGMGPKGAAVSYVEQTVGWRTGRAELGEMNLADFAAFVPDLNKLGIDPKTKLVAYPAFGWRARPGFIEVPGLEGRTAVSMEAWSRTPDGAPIVFDFSFGYEGDFAAMKDAHKASEKAMAALYKELGDKLGYPQGERYVGSKVRILLNQPK